MEKISLLGNDNVADDVPYDLIKLPSKGIVYDEDHPLHGEEDVAFRAPGAPEENILTSVALIKKGTVINTLIRSLLINKSIDPTDLLIGDKSAITLMIRIAGFGKEYKTKTRCPSCGNDFAHEFDLSKCQYKFLQVDPVVKGKNLFDFTLPFSKKKVLFSLLTDKQDVEITKAQTNRKKAMGGEVDTIITDRLLTQIKEIEGIPREGIADFVNSGKMSMRDSRALRNYINKINPDVLLEEKVSCNLCSAEEVHTIPLGLEFFWPKME